MSRLPHKIVARWLERVADGLEAGFPANAAVEYAKALPKGRSTALISSFEAGEGWIDALGSIDGLLERGELGIVYAAERSGSLPMAFRSIAQTRDDRAAARSKLIIASLYPLLVAHMAAFAFAIPLMVEGSTTAFLVSAGLVIVPIWSVIAFFVIAFRIWPNFPRALMRSVPIFAAYRRLWDASVLCRALATGFRAGMRADEAWEVGMLAADHPAMSRMATEALAAIRRGAPATEGIAQARRGVPDSFLQVYVNGERNGNLDTALEKVGDLYAKEAKGRLLLAAIIYPKLLLIPVMGFVGYRIIMYFKDYYQGILDITA